MHIIAERKASLAKHPNGFGWGVQAKRRRLLAINHIDTKKAAALVLKAFCLAQCPSVFDGSVSFTCTAGHQGFLELGYSDGTQPLLQLQSELSETVPCILAVNGTRGVCTAAMYCRG